MALTASQIAWTRFYMGYSVAGDVTLAGSREPAYTNTRLFSSVSLDEAAQGFGLLLHLAAEQEAMLTGTFLPELDACRAEITGARGNLDTDQAAVWKHNKSEMAERRAEYRTLRLQLCQFLGFPPGSGLRASNTMVRG